MTGERMGEVREVLAGRLTHGSFAHCQAVSVTAREIAAVYGADADAAEMAGLLHDWSRDESDEYLLAAADRFGLSVNAIEHSRPYLLHARVAAEEIGQTWPWIEAEVLSAIEGHTLGPAGDDGLAMVVYVADMVEPGRRWDGVEELRDAVGKVELDELYVRALQHTLEGLVRGRKRIHPRALDSWNSMVGVVRP